MNFCIVCGVGIGIGSLCEKCKQAKTIRANPLEAMARALWHEHYPDIRWEDAPDDVRAEYFRWVKVITNALADNVSEKMVETHYNATGSQQERIAAAIRAAGEG